MSYIAGTVARWVVGEKSISGIAAQWTSFLGFAVAIVGIISWLSNWLTKSLTLIAEFLIEIISAQIPQIPWAGVQNLFNIANSFFPVVEALAMYSTLYTFWGLVITVRWIKSFIPTVAN